MSTQVKLRRLVRLYGESVDRFRGEPAERRTVAAVVGRLTELAGQVREAWERESFTQPVEAALERYVHEELRTVELAIAGLQQAGADLELLRSDFEEAALPLEVFLRGLDVAPALQRSA
ncbi:MAG: hypothetical protein ACREOM_06060 [Candidatus Dormibacteraceae bacterium]